MRHLAALTLLSIVSAASHGAASCTASATAMSFGNYSPLASSSSIQALGAVSVSCSRSFGDLDTVVNFNAVIGPGSSGNYGARTLRSGSGQLAYQLYKTANGQSPWLATGETGSLSLPLFGNRRATKDYAVFGQIVPLQSSARPGTYTDTLSFTVTYD